MSEAGSPVPQGGHLEEQAKAQTGQQQIRLNIDERNLKTSYANAFRTNGTAEEVMLDFGLNLVGPPAQQECPFGRPEKTENPRGRTEAAAGIRAWMGPAGGRGVGVRAGRRRSRTGGGWPHPAGRPWPEGRVRR